VYPALTVLDALTSERSNVQVLWVGGEGGMETGLVQRAGIPFKTIPAAGLHGVGLKHLPRNIMQVLRGINAASKILREFKPDVLMFTGGYLAFPMAVAGWRIPSLLYVPDIEPGIAIKVISRFVKCIALTAEQSRQYLSKHTNILITGYPIRRDLSKWTRESALKVLGLSATLPTLLVFGGSKGAQSLNNAIQEHLPALLSKIQIVHISGELDWPAVENARKNLTTDQAKRYHAYPYLHEEMGAALAAADLVVSRAGASTLGEFPFFGLPAVLVPYPYAWRYQKVNADFLANKGAAVILEDARLQEELYAVIHALLESPAKRQSMRRAMQSLAHPNAASTIAAQLIALSGG
jgi:UDP-N-acetylglucosamine--N-acetylmuramyl-(pentapeptide) pyrophosphoryl-undecaprenol N-acetylglucosamine transferase